MSTARIGTEGPVRPWGSYTVVDDGPSHQVKRIVVTAGRRLSYQVHARRAEHWFIVSGRGVAVVDGRRIEVDPGAAVDIPIGVAHRMENPGTENLVFVEVQHGDYFGEEDIVRLDDDFGRVSGATSIVRST